MTAQLPSKERLEKIASWRETYGAGHNVMLPAEEAEAMARALLAGMEQEPDLYLCPVTRNGERLFSPCGRDYPRGRGYYTRPAPSIPTVSFYRDGIAAAAAWVDAQREAYDNEHGRHDPDTGTFEFGNDAQLEYSSTLVEIAEGIRALHPNASSALSIPAAVPEGWKLVPVIADADMSHAGHMYYQQSKRDTGDFTPTGMFSAMIKASPAAPAPAVPDEIDIKQAYQYMRSNSLAGCYRDGWNDRDAMLNHSGVPDEDQ